MTVVVACSPHTASLDINFQKNQSSPEFFSVLAKYDEVSAQEATVAFRLATEEGPVVDLSGVVEPERVPECHGIKIDTVVSTSLIGTYNVLTKVCQPGFIESTIDKYGEGDVYNARMGFLASGSAETSVAMYSKVEQVRHNIVMARVKLISLLNSDTDFEYKEEEFKMLQVCRTSK